MLLLCPSIFPEVKYQVVESDSKLWADSLRAGETLPIGRRGEACLALCADSTFHELLKCCFCGRRMRRPYEIGFHNSESHLFLPPSIKLPSGNRGYHISSSSGRGRVEQAASLFRWAWKACPRMK
jgi:hypothetical protein